MIPALVGAALLSSTSASAAGSKDPDGFNGPAAPAARHSQRGAVAITEAELPVSGQKPISVYVVSPVNASRPADRSLAGVLYLHWFEPPASTQNRTEFLAEAVEVASRGAVAVLPQLTFPWQGDPVGDAHDRAAVEAQLAAVTKAYEFLVAQRGVDARRIAVVGHDYGAMYASMLAAQQARRQRPVKATVLMTPDATWANWFDTYWLMLPAELKPAYRALFAGLDPVDNVGRLGGSLYFQFAAGDKFVPAETRAAFAAANPRATISLYEGADHFLQQPAKDDRIAWIEARLDAREVARPLTAPSAS